MIVGLNSIGILFCLIGYCFRVTDERFFVFKGFLEIPFYVIMNHKYIYYKYAARTGRTAEIVAEHIWNVSFIKSVCRCFEIPGPEKKPGG